MTSERRRSVGTIAAVGTTGLGLVVLVGWAAGWTRLTSVWAGLIAMNPATAVGLVFGGTALGFVASPRKRLHTVAMAFALATAMLGIIRLLALVADIGLDVDLILFRDAVMAAVPRSRMAAGTAAGLVFNGMALFLLASGRRTRVAQLLAAAAAALALVTACGYLYGVMAYPDDVPALPMALNTAAGLLALAIGALYTSGIQTSLLRESPGGLLTRRLLPAALLLPVAVGALRLLGERHGWYDARLGVSLMAVTTMVLLVALVLSTAAVFDRADVERRRAEQQLREYAAEVADLYDHAPCGYHSLDEHGIFRRINETELRWLGYTHAEVVGRLSFADILTPADAAQFRERFARFKTDGRQDDYEFEVVRKDGSTFFVSVSATTIRGAHGAYRASRSTMFDITERKRTDTAIHQMNLMLADRVAALDEINGDLESFSYSVSHDLRAPLRHVTGFASLLERHAADRLDQRGRHYLDRITTATQSMGRLIDDLLAFSRMGRSDMQRATVDLNRLVADVQHALQPDLDGRQIEWRVDPLPRVQGDESMLRTVLVNLLSNAVKYTRPRSPARIHVGTADRTLEGHYHLFVQDNGVGFDMQYVDRLFGVFQRLHHADEFEGTGIGLATTRRVIARHGGRTWAEGAIDTGATIHFTLPAPEGCTDNEHQADSPRRG